MQRSSVPTVDDVKELRAMFRRVEKETIEAMQGRCTAAQMAVIRAELRKRSAGAALYEALTGIVESATDGRSIPEWLQEHIADAQEAIRKAESE